MRVVSHALAFCALLAMTSAGIPQPTATPLSSGIQQASTATVAGTSKMILVGPDGITPLLVTSNPQAPQGLGVVPFLFNGQGLEEQVNNQNLRIIAPANYTTIQTSALQANFNAQGLVIWLVVHTAPNTSETLTIRFYVAVDNFAQGAAGRQLYSFTTGLGSAQQTNPDYDWGLFIYPGATATPDTTFYKIVSAPAPRQWQLDINPSSTSIWNYEVHAGYIL